MAMVLAGTAEPARHAAGLIEAAYAAMRALGTRWLEVLWHSLTKRRAL